MGLGNLPYNTFYAGCVYAEFYKQVSPYIDCIFYEVLTR